MGPLDSAHLVGLFLLYSLAAYRDIDFNSIGFNIDDGLMVVNDSTGSKFDKHKLIN